MRSGQDGKLDKKAGRDILSPMSFLFHKRTKKALNIVWSVVAVIVMLGMVLFFAPGLVTYLSS